MFTAGIVPWSYWFLDIICVWELVDSTPWGGQTGAHSMTGPAHVESNPPNLHILLAKQGQQLSLFSALTFSANAYTQGDVKVGEQVASGHVVDWCIGLSTVSCTRCIDSTICTVPVPRLAASWPHSDCTHQSIWRIPYVPVLCTAVYGQHTVNTV